MRLNRPTMAARASSVCRMRSPKFWLGLLSTTTTATELERVAILARQRGVGERAVPTSAQTGRADPQRRGCAKRTAARPGCSVTAKRPKNSWTLTRGERDTEVHVCFFWLPACSSSCWDTPHLVGLVIAGERVHHHVDAGAERHFALARLAFDHRQHPLAVDLHRPGAGKIVGRDDVSRRRRRRREQGRLPQLSSSSSFALASLDLRAGRKRPGKSRNR